MSPISGRSSSKRSMPRSPSPASKISRHPPNLFGAAEDVSAIGFDSLGLKEFLEPDSRPAFAVDLAAAAQKENALSRIVYANGPMRMSRCQHNLVAITNDPTLLDDETLDFWAWVVNRTGAEYGTDFEAYSYAGMRWVRTTLRSRWRVISGCDSVRLEQMYEEEMTDEMTDLSPTKTIQIHSIQPRLSSAAIIRNSHDTWGKSGSAVPTPTTTMRPPSPHAAIVRRPSASRMPSKNDMKQDWTAANPPANMSPHIRLARSIDWSKTALGPMESWSDGFRMACNLLMADPRAATLIWGPERNMLYNESYIEVAGKERHPARFGLPFKEVFPEVTGFYDYFYMIEKTGQGITKEDTEFQLERHGYIEETFFSFTLTPLWDNEKLGGFYNPVFETTRRQIAERRMTTLIKLGESTSANRDIKQFWRQAIHALQLNEHDFPFASVYSVTIHEDMSDTASESSDGSGTLSKKLKLEGSVGIPFGHPAVAPEQDLSNGQEGFLPYFRAAARSGDVVSLHTGNGTLNDDLLQDIRCRPFGDTCRSIVILPIKPTVGPENIGGFVLLGLNPRRPYDEDYHVFFQLFCRLLGASMAASILVEEEMRKSRTAAKRAALDQLKLAQELARSEQEAKRLEMQFTHFAERAPVGITMINADGKMIYANSVWYDVTMSDNADDSPMAWMKYLDLGDGLSVEAMWRKLLVDKHSVTIECRLKKPWRPPGSAGTDEGTDFTWVIFSAYPELNPVDGDVDAVVGCFMDISQHKWAEELQKRRMNEAIEAKTLQEKFIDMTSHEMRNPLSAIIHCCDGIISALSATNGVSEDTFEVSQEAVANSLDAARTILHCSVHQKRIVDDILTLSKLDSDLLPVAPVNVEILRTVKEALSMFNAEVKSADIKLLFEVDESFTRLGLDWVFVDPSRLTQVFINLITNAIKFTQTEVRRVIRVKLAASLGKPNTSDTGVKYVKGRHPDRLDITSHADWGSGEIVYLQFAVEDTGRGLTESEIDVLFRRFSQASPRTHVQYGGSGLGLYIARELTEKQGGEIGVASRSGEGSTFAFYVKSRRAPRRETAPRRGRTQSTSQFAVGLERKLSASAPNSQDGSSQKTLAPSKNAKPVPNKRFPVLIVEDNLVNRKVLKKQLSNLGFPIHEANHGEEALAFLRETKFWAGNERDGKDLAIVLLDCEMPVMDGLTCIRRIRALEADGTVTAHVPTIAVTANARREQIETALEAGMDEVVCKPFRIPELVAQMEAMEMESRTSRVGL